MKEERMLSSVQMHTHDPLSKGGDSMMTPERRAELREHVREFGGGISSKEAIECLDEIDRLTAENVAWKRSDECVRLACEDAGILTRFQPSGCPRDLDDAVKDLALENARLSNALDLAAAELDAQTKEIDRLSKVVDQAIEFASFEIRPECEMVKAKIRTTLHGERGRDELDRWPELERRSKA